jgi:hypothetical protein
VGAEALAAWLGLLASAAGVAAALFFAQAASRTVDDEAARNALLLLDGAFADRKPDGTGQAPENGGEAEQPTGLALRDLTDEILQKNKANRRDMKIGARLLVLTFALLVAQSLVMLGLAR